MKLNKMIRLLFPLLYTTLLLAVVFPAPQTKAAEIVDEKAPETSSYFNDEFMANHMQTLFTDQNGLVINEINDICQTIDGYLWIASYSGITRYDGKQFTTYNTDSTPALPASGVVCLYSDSSQRLWIGSNDNGLIKYEDGSFTKLDSANLGLSIRAVTEDSKGQIFAATTEGVGYVGNDNSLLPISAEKNLQVSADDVVVDSQDRLWVLLSSGEIVVLKDGKMAQTFSPGDEQYGRFTSLYADSDGTIQAGTEDGNVLCFQIKKDKILQKNKIVIDGITQINSFYRDNEERLWVCSDNQLGYLDQELQYIPLANCRLTNSIERIIQDYEGTYWVASSRQGVLNISTSKFFNLSEAYSLPEETINSIQIVHDNLYIASDTGLFIVEPQGKLIETPLTKLLKGSRIRQLYVDSQQQLWISTYRSHGLICVKEDDSYTIYNENDGLAANTIRSVLERQDGSMAVATGQGVDILKNGVVINHYGVEEGLSNPVILTMCEDQSGRLYLGSDGNGIYIIDSADGKVSQIKPSDGLTTGIILRMALDPEDRGLWISSGNQIDFYDFKSGKCDSVANLDAFQSNAFDFHFLSNKKMLILCAKGMAVVDISDFSGLDGDKKKFPIEYYERNAGLSATVTANSWSCLSEDGILYLSLNPGVNVIDLGATSPNTYTPKVAVSHIQVDDKEFEGTKIKVPSDATRITIDFSVPSFVEQDRLKITYQMEGFDPKPITISWKDSFSVSYTNLTGGDYVFRVSAANGEGVSSEHPAFASIEKARKLRESPVAIICVTVIGIIILWVLIMLYLRTKTKKMQKEQQKYRDITEQSLQTIANTIDAKDSNTNGHSIRVARYAREIARRMNLQRQEQEQVYYSALLHDIGKIGIPDAILHKPGALTAEEMQIMRSHVTIGSEILKDFHSIPDIHAIVGSHHEDYSGGGYPYGIDNDSIPLSAQIIRVADAYDAMASHRSYRASMTQIYILSELKKYRGTQFNPEIAKIMEEMIQDGFMTDEEQWDENKKNSKTLKK